MTRTLYTNARLFTGVDEQIIDDEDKEVHAGARRQGQLE